MRPATVVVIVVLLHQSAARVLLSKLQDAVPRRRDISQLQSVCSFYPESYIAMQEEGGQQLVEVKKWRHVPLCCPGYERKRAGHDLETYECKPVCDSCHFGMCVSPNRCRCDDGYGNPPGKLDTCVPECFPPCRNAYCAGPNRCACEKGFQEDEFIPHLCVKRPRRQTKKSYVVDPCFAPGTINCPISPIHTIPLLNTTHN